MTVSTLPGEIAEAEERLDAVSADFRVHTLDRSAIFGGQVSGKQTSQSVRSPRRQSVSLIQNRRLGKLAQKLRRCWPKSVERERVCSALWGYRDLATGSHRRLIDIKRDISVLSEGLWNLNNTNEAILNHLEDERQRKDQLDTLKLLIIEIESQLDAIDELAKHMLFGRPSRPKSCLIH